MPAIYGINPVLEALKSGQPVEKIYVLSGRQSGPIRTIYKEAKARHVRIVQADRKKIAQIAGKGNHQGVVAFISPVNYVSIESLMDKIFRQGRVPNLVVIDRLQDPHNLGAIIRSAEIFGADGIILSERDTVPLTDVVVKASAGAVFNIDVCRTRHLASAIDYLKNSGVWIYAATPETGQSLWEMDFTAATAIIIGSEGKGVKPQLIKNSDGKFRIPQSGKTQSLNASVSAGIILAEIQRQRIAGTG